jgi:hypothetical protein
VTLGALGHQWNVVRERQDDLETAFRDNLPHRSSGRMQGLGTIRQFSPRRDFTSIAVFMNSLTVLIRLCVLHGYRPAAQLTNRELWVRQR